MRQSLICSVCQHPPTIPISLIVPMYHTEVLVCELHVAAAERISAWRWNWTRSSSPRARRPRHPASRPSGCLLPRRWMRTAAPPDESSSVSSSPAAITMDVHRKGDGRRAFRAPTSPTRTEYCIDVLTPAAQKISQSVLASGAIFRALVLTSQKPLQSARRTT